VKISILAIPMSFAPVQHQCLHPCGHQSSTGQAALGGLLRRLTPRAA
jgi:hypothetical protein